MTEIEQIRVVVGIQTATYRKMGLTDSRSKILAALRLACEPCKDTNRWVKDSHDPEKCVISAEGMFRIVAAEHHADLKDPYTQERYAKLVTDAIDANR